MGDSKYYNEFPPLAFEQVRDLAGAIRDDFEASLAGTIRTPAADVS
jgi:hypothetical protein